ncbi:hypothetical protein TNCV_1847931, partial [Trichonephila clavipes]
MNSGQLKRRHLLLYRRCHEREKRTPFEKNYQWNLRKFVRVSGFQRTLNSVSGKSLFSHMAFRLVVKLEISKVRKSVESESSYWLLGSEDNGSKMAAHVDEKNLYCVSILDRK